jgi:hypothetical protein
MQLAPLAVTSQRLLHKNLPERVHAVPGSILNFFGADVQILQTWAIATALLKLGDGSVLHLLLRRRRSSGQSNVVMYMDDRTARAVIDDANPVHLCPQCPATTVH